jgi:hypothetical protein
MYIKRHMGQEENVENILNKMGPLNEQPLSSCCVHLSQSHFYLFDIYFLPNYPIFFKQSFWFKTKCKVFPEAPLPYNVASYICMWQLNQ